MKQRLEKAVDIGEMCISTFSLIRKASTRGQCLDSGIGISAGVIKIRSPCLGIENFALSLRLSMRLDSTQYVYNVENVYIKTSIFPECFKYLNSAY
jgi:hypothetical protein